MINLSILDTAAYRINEDNWLKEATVSLEYCCNICFQCCYKSDLLKLKTSKYDKYLTDLTKTMGICI